MIILGSSSVTRAAMLEAAGIPFCQKSGDFDEETLTQTDPDAFVVAATRGKMERCTQLYGLAMPILCADTVVETGGTILRKAKNRDDARTILTRQSGATVSIRTCTMLRSTRLDLIDLSVTSYRFDPFDPDDLERYLASGDWEGKAGACMVEGFCKSYIRSVTGLESTAMGLSLERILPFLALHARWEASHGCV